MYIWRKISSLKEENPKKSSFEVKIIAMYQQSRDCKGAGAIVFITLGTLNGHLIVSCIMYAYKKGTSSNLFQTV